jgi:hypothetical protein
MKCLKLDKEKHLRSLASASSGGGGNCTRHSIYSTRCPLCGCALSPGDAQGMCREDEALSELVARWHRLTSNVRKTILEVARGAGQRR